MEEIVLWTHSTPTLTAKAVRLNNSDAQLVVVDQEGAIKHDSTTKLTNGKSDGIALEDVLAWQKTISEIV